MSVNPGSEGQASLPEVLPKIRELRRVRVCGARGLTIWIAVDEGQNGETAWRALEARADGLVAGSAVLRAADYAVQV